MPYNKDDDVIKATSFEVISTLRDVLKTSSLWRDHVQTYTQVSFIFETFGIFVSNVVLISFAIMRMFIILWLAKHLIDLLLTAV